MSSAQRVFFAGAGLRRSATTPSPGAGPSAVRCWWSVTPRVASTAFDGKSGASAWARQGAHDGAAYSRWRSTQAEPRSLTAGQDGRVLIWDVAEGQVKQAIDVGSDWVENVAWSPDGQWLAASCSRQVRAYGADGGEVWRSDDHPSTVSAIAWSSARELATACYGRVTFFRRIYWGASPEAGVDGLLGVDGTESGRGYRGLRQPGQFGAFLASLHGAGLDDVRISCQAVGLGLR